MINHDVYRQFQDSSVQPVVRLALLLSVLAAAGCGASATTGSGNSADTQTTGQDIAVTGDVELDANGDSLLGDSVAADTSDAAIGDDAINIDGFDIAGLDIGDIDTANLDVPTTCKIDADCKIDAPCVAAKCTAGTCSFSPATGACDDGDPCTKDDTCDNGVCLPGSPTNCDDANPCTTDGCQAGLGCAHTPTDGPCKDGDPCTMGDMCLVGICIGAAADCNDNNPCSEDYCDPVKGCEHHALVAPCSDGNACTDNDTCANSACVPGEPLKCDDGTPCTQDACDKLNGCVFTATDATCTDGDACTTGDNCVKGACTSTGVVKCDDQNSCTADSCAADVGCVATNTDGVQCDDGQICSIKDACSGGKCLGVVASCDDGNPCTDDTCGDGVGCVHLANTATCSDDNACTTDDVCAKEVCTGLAVNCDDKDSCTQDGCKPSTGCINAVLSDGASCSDGDLCTTGDVCIGGKCSSSQVTCPAPDQCHDQGTCDPTTGQCTQPIKKPTQVLANDCCSAHGPGCMDMNVVMCVCSIDSYCCNKAWDAGCVDKAVNLCGAGNCMMDVTPTCDDGLGCTENDLCDTGKCAGTPNDSACVDKIPCTADVCDPLKGCSNAVMQTGPCDDGDLCTTEDACTSGVCSGAQVICDDKSPCTIDSCNPVKGCLAVAGNDGASCDDASLCTAMDTCAGGVCAGTPNVVCPAPDQCHVLGTCEPTTGACTNPIKVGVQPTVCATSTCCTAHGAGCSDAATQACVCGVDPFCCNFYWDPGCVGEAQTNCGAAKPLPPLPVSCDDAVTCTSDDACSDGICSGVPVDTACDDMNPCTADSCDMAKGCTHTNLDAIVCDDGISCTFNDTCSGGSCSGVDDNASCNDNNACTSDICAGQTGCLNFPLDAMPCDDGSACTVGDACVGSTCTPGEPVVCPTADQCHEANVCDPATGGCSNTAKPDTTACNDGNACTAGEACVSGACTGGSAPTCNDSNACTADACNPTSGCTFTPVAAGAACTDSNACTADACNATGSCVATAIAITDNNGCTTDACNATSGVVTHTAIAGCCAHSMCTAGPALSSTACNYGTAASYNDCASALCAKDPFCCSNSWDSICVGEAKNIAYCTTGSTAFTCTCTHSYCATGPALTKLCDPCVKRICETDSFCCTNSWDNACVGEVTSICKIPAGADCK